MANVPFGAGGTDAPLRDAVRCAAEELAEIIGLCAPHTRPLAEAMYRATARLLHLAGAGHGRRAEMVLRQLCGAALRMAEVPASAVEAWRLDEAITDAARMIRARDRLDAAAEFRATPTPQLVGDAATLMHYYGAVGILSGEVELMLWASPQMVERWPSILRYMEWLHEAGHLPRDDVAPLRGTWRRAAAEIARWADAHAPRFRSAL